MVSLNMTWYSSILTTALLFCVFVVVTEGRSVENERRLPEEEFDLDIKTDEDDREEARYMPSGGESFSGMMGQIMKMIQSHMGEGTEQPNVSIIFLPIGGGGGGGAVDDYVDIDDDLPAEEIAGAIVPEVIGAVVADLEEDAATDADDIRRRRRRRRRPVNSGYRRVYQNRKRRPNGRQVFVIRSSDTTK